MRIIGGIFKGRKLKFPKRKTTRPTSSKVREALFNIIMSRVSDCVFVDLFAGSGAVGLEALSRGARFVIFIEKDVRACGIIKQNIKNLGIDENKTLIICDDAISGLKKLEKKRYSFDIIFIDPPYYKKMIKPCLSFLKSSAQMSSDAIIILQYSKDEIISTKDFIVNKEKKYGRTFLSFLTRSENI